MWGGMGGRRQKSVRDIAIFNIVAEESRLTKEYLSPYWIVYCTTMCNIRHKRKPFLLSHRAKVFGEGKGENRGGGEKGFDFPFPATSGSVVVLLFLFWTARGGGVEERERRRSFAC